MSMTRTLAELVKECLTRGIDTSSLTGKYGKREVLELLVKDSLSKLPSVSYGLQRRLAYETPMVCFTFKHLKPVEQENLWTSPNWGLDEKYDGCRMWLIYHPDHGFWAFSRNISVEDFLPVDYTPKILFIKDGMVRTPESFKGVFSRPFIVDTEVICPNAKIDTSILGRTGVVTDTELNAVTAILALAPEASHKIQIEQAQLEFRCFDTIELDGAPVWESPLRHRIPKTEWIVKGLQLKGVPATYKPMVFTEEAKRLYYKELIDSGKEGGVFKNLDAAYIPTSSRPRTGWVKIKRSVGESLGKDIDAFISGYVLPDPDKGWKDCIGAIELSVLLTKKDGTEVDHVMASVSSIPLEMRKMMSEMGEDGLPRLKKEFYGKVMIINGQDISARQKRFMHATTNWDVGFRSDKTRFDCTFDEVVLDSLVL